MPTATDSSLLKLSPTDNVLVLIKPLPADASCVIDGQTHRLERALGLGHKLAARDIEIL